MPTKKLYTIHAVEDDHLAKVIADMQQLGAPTIRVVDCGDYLQAIEGTHRIAAAHKLDVVPKLVILAQDDMVEADSLDMDYFLAGHTYTAGEIAGEIRPHTAYRIEMDAYGNVTGWGE